MSEVIISRRGGSSEGAKPKGLKTVYITQNAQWEVPRNVKNNSFDVRIFGGGGGGHKGSDGNNYYSFSLDAGPGGTAIGGGSSGVMNNSIFTNLTPGSIININIGKGGSVGYTNRTTTKNTTSGGTTTFGSYLSANGGSGSIYSGCLIGGSGGTGFLNQGAIMNYGALQFGGSSGYFGGIWGGGGGAILSYRFATNNMGICDYLSVIHTGETRYGGTYGGGGGTVHPLQVINIYPNSYRGVGLDYHAIYYNGSGGNGGMYGGGGGGCASYNNYINSKTLNNYLNITNFINGCGGTGYGGDGSIIILQNYDMTNYTYLIRNNARTSKNGTNTSTWTNVDNVGGVLLRGWGRHGSDTYGPGGGGGYGGNGGNGANAYINSSTPFPIVGGGGGGYGSNGGNGYSYQYMNVYENCTVFIAHGGGGGGYGGDGRHGGGGYGKQAIGGECIVYKVNYDNNGSKRYIVGAAGGGGYFCPANGCAGGGIGIWSGNTMTASYGSGGNGGNGEDGVCIIQYYEE